MEDDRDEVDLGVAVDIEQRLEEAAAAKQPKKRFVGRRQIGESRTRVDSEGSTIEDSGTIQSVFLSTETGITILTNFQSLSVAERLERSTKYLSKY